MRMFTRTVAGLLASLMLVLFVGMPVSAANETHAASYAASGNPENLSAYNAGDVAAINAMIQGNATLNGRYKANEPWNWDFVDWMPEGPIGSSPWGPNHPALATSITFSRNNISLSLGGAISLSNCSVQDLWCVGNGITSIQLSNLPNLNLLYCNENKITALELHSLPNLVTVNAKSNRIEKVGFSNLPKIESVSLDDNRIADLDLSKIPTITHITLDGNAYAPYYPKYKKDNVSGAFNSIDLTGCSNLEYFYNFWGGEFIVNRITIPNGKTVVFKHHSVAPIKISYVAPKNTRELMSSWQNTITPNIALSALLAGYVVKGWKFSSPVKHPLWPAYYNTNTFTPNAQTTTVSAILAKDIKFRLALKVKFPQSSVRLLQNKSIVIPASAYSEQGKLNTVYYKVANENIATVNASGKIVAKSPGTTTITAYSHDSKKKATLKVTVLAAGAKTTKVSKVTANVPKNMSVGAVKYITPKYTPAKATNVKVTYSSKDKSIVSVDKAGRLVAKKAGTARIVVKAGGKSRTYTITVT